MWTWLAVTAHAADGYWHPDDLAPLSKVYGESSPRMQEPFKARSQDADVLANALNQYQEALDLLGDQAPAAERARLDELQKTYHREHAVLEAFANQVGGDYDDAFMAAVDRAVAAHKGKVAQCATTIRTAAALAGMPGKKNANCTGDDLNAELAAKVDADPVLKAALDEILSRPWPEVALETAPQAPIGAGDRWINVRDLMFAGNRKALRQISAADDEARDKIAAAIEEGATTEQLEALKPEVAKIEAMTAAKRAALADPILEIALGRMAKTWKGEPPTGWCANPRPLGGCTGTDDSNALVARLLEDKKVIKAFGP